MAEARRLSKHISTRSSMSEPISPSDHRTIPQKAGHTTAVHASANRTQICPASRPGLACWTHRPPAEGYAARCDWPPSGALAPDVLVAAGHEAALQLQGFEGLQILWVATGDGASQGLHTLLNGERETWAGRSTQRKVVPHKVMLVGTVPITAPPPLSAPLPATPMHAPSCRRGSTHRPLRRRELRWS